jgi:hypothetical protein
MELEVLHVVCHNNLVNAELRGTLFAKDDDGKSASSMTITSVFTGSTGAEFA